MFEIKGDDLDAQEVVDVLVTRLDGEVEVEQVVEGDGDRRNKVDEHASQLALPRRVNSQVHRHGLAPVEIVTFAGRTTTG